MAGQLSCRSNPYSTAHLWDEATLAAYQSMPTTAQGHVVSLLYLEQREALRMEGLWREWCRQTPRHLWPTWLERWPDHKRVKGWA